MSDLNHKHLHITMYELEYDLTQLMLDRQMVGYSIEHDEIFVYCIDDRGFCWIFRDTDRGFFGPIDFEDVEILGEL